MGEMRVMSPKGDIVLEWDADDPESVGKAKEEWDKLKAAGFHFFDAANRGTTKKLKRITRWSKKLGSVLAAPGVQTKADKKAGKREKAMAGGPTRTPRIGLVTRPPTKVELADSRRFYEGIRL